MTDAEAVVPVGRGIELCHDAFGDPNHETVVLIAGLGQQKHTWPAELAAGIASRGYRVIRFDNRDVGCSTHMDFPAPSTLAVLRGRNHERQYHLGDMARDTVGLLDALGHRDAHNGSHGYPFDEEWVRDKAGTAWDRDPTTDGCRRPARRHLRRWRSHRRTPAD